MNLIIFGASGGTGKLLTQQALQKGYNVTAYVRTPENFTLKHPKLKVIKGDVLNTIEVEHAIYGHDAVLSCIGSPANKIGVIRSQGTKNIVTAMNKAGINRFICQTSLGYGDTVKTLDRTPWYFKHLIVPYILKKGFADHALQERYIKESNLDWVIARPGNLTDGNHTGRYQHGFAADSKNIQVKISRADVADFMLKQIESDTYLRKTPGLSY